MLAEEIDTWANELANADSEQVRSILSAAGVHLGPQLGVEQISRLQQTAANVAGHLGAQNVLASPVGGAAPLLLALFDSEKLPIMPHEAPAHTQVAEYLLKIADRLEHPVMQMRTTEARQHIASQEAEWQQAAHERAERHIKEID